MALKRKRVEQRRRLVAGNWKMNGTVAQLGEIAAVAGTLRDGSGVDVAICPPFTLIAPAVTRAGGSLAIGGQDCHAAASGAHTGCVSAAMLKEMGARLVIVGHSERRADQGESDAVVREKAAAAMAGGLQTIVCVGESEAQREAGRAIEIVRGQLAGSLPEGEAAELVVAYEPIWAIGTGKTATPADVGEMHAAIRAALNEMFGPRGNRIRILYGGSVKASNAAELFAVPDVDGALVGGASLSAGDFCPIIEAARSAG